MSDAKDSDIEISRLFDEARSQLGMIESNSKQQKKQVVKDLAKRLENKIQTDTICIEITNQLRGQVAESFVRQCLDEKYKQKPRVENARKQKKQERSIGKDNLASLPSLTPVTKDKKILVDANGRVSFEEDGEGDEDQIDEDNKSSTLIESSTTVWEERPLNNEQKGEDLKQSSQSVMDDMLILDSTAERELDVSSSIDLFPFVFSMHYGDLREQMRTIFPNTCSYTEIWFSGKIDKNTGEVLSASFDGLHPHR
ncbi:MAG TPA: hypothetical protein VD815_02135 [Candidatus Saccharimonadales bacterium]|nr:hypothetical protein [Candidatus Saccharimonadales bacterium]